MSNKRNSKRVGIFACGNLALPVIAMLRECNQLGAVIIPAPSELGSLYGEAIHLAQTLQQAQINFFYTTKNKLLNIPKLLDNQQIELGLIFTFPHILPSEVLNYFNGNCYNLHASALPAYSGPCPLYWQIRNQETHTAIALQKAELKADTGKVLHAHNLPIDPLDTLQRLGNQISWQAQSVVKEFLDGATLASTATQLPLPRDVTQPGVQYARRPTPNDSAIHFETQTPAEISAMCRAGAGQPYAATFSISGVAIYLLQATPVNQPCYGTQPGTVLMVGEPEGLIVATSHGAIRLDILSSIDGTFSGLAFAERFGIDAGVKL